MSGETIARVLLAGNAAADLVLAVGASGIALPQLRPAFRALADASGSQAVADAAIEASAAGFMGHALVRFAGAVHFDSPLARRFVQLSYLGELLTFLVLRRHVTFPDAAPFFVVPAIVVVALQLFPGKAKDKKN